MKSDETILYYNQNAESFISTTQNVSFLSVQSKFLKKLHQNASILDFGCGSGRDTKYFLEQGYSVEAIDGSEELCKLASVFTGIEVKHMLFNELEEMDKYDGIWACSSILHLPYAELVDVIKKMVIALKDNGIIYTSFKYGIFEGMRNGRYFNDMTEERFRKLLQDVEGLEIEEIWVSSDVRPGRGEEKWLNLILRKK
ncbi:MAG: class I SAM-dependent methyltransferase [Lachnospiraceae bacterium]|nr:class I SAM-dependent methyltransferase [Lachnospiraceae bacterium]